MILITVTTVNDETGKVENTHLTTLRAPMLGYEIEEAFEAAAKEVIKAFDPHYLED